MMNANEIWEKTLETVKDDILPVSFFTWIKPLECVGVTKNVFVLYSENKIVSKMVEERYKEMLQKALLSVTGKEYNLKVIHSK